MSSAKIILLFVILGSVVSFNQFKISASNKWSCATDEDFTECLKKYLRKDIVKIKTKNNFLFSSIKFIEK